MSKENVEIARRGTDALNRLDLDACADLATADFEWFPVLGSTVEGKSLRLASSLRYASCPAEVKPERENQRRCPDL